MKIIIAYIIIGIGILMASFGVLGLFRFRDLYQRLLVSSNVDIVGVLFMLSGAIIMSPDWIFALKIFLVCFLSLMTAPLSSHATVLSAYDSGYRVK